MDGGPDNQGSRREEEHLPWQQMQMPHQQRMDPQDKGDGAMGGGNQDISEDLMMKVRQHQQLLDLEKKREAQQKLMEQQQLAMLEAQRNEQQQRMLPPGSGQSLAPAGMPTTPSIRSSGVSMVSAPLNPPGMTNQPSQGMGPPGVVIPPGSMPNQQQMMQGGPPSLIGQQNPQGGPPGSQGQLQQGGPPPPPHIMQGGPQHLGQGGPPRSMNQMGDQDHRQMPPQMGDRPPMQQMGERPPMQQMGDRPNLPPMGDLQQMQQMGDQDLRQQIGDRPPMPQMGDRTPIQPMGDQDHRQMPPMGDHQQMQQMSDRPPMQLGGPQMHQSGPMMQPGGPPRPQGGPPMSQGGPQMAQGGPPMSQGGPPHPMQQMGERPPMPQGGPQMSQGGPRGPMQQMGDRPPMSQGGSMMAPGGPQISQGGPPMSQGAPHMQQGGSQMSQGGPSMSQGGPHMQQRGPPMSQQSGPLMQQGGPQMSQSGPPGGPPMSQGGRPIGQGGPPMSQAGSTQMSQSSGDRPPLQPPALMSQNMRPLGPGKDSMSGPHGPTPDAGPRPMMTRTPYNGPSRPPTAGPRPSVPPVSQQGPKEMRLPQALEKMLEFKTQRETEVGAELDLDKEEAENDSDEEERKGVTDKDDVNEDEDNEEEEIFEIMAKDQSKESKNKRKKKKKKKAKRNRFEQQKKSKKKDKKSKMPEVQVEYIQEQPELDPSDPNYHTFARIFEAFKITEPEKPKEVKVEEEEQAKPKEETPIKAKGILDDDDDDDDDEMMADDDDGPKISKKKLKKLTRLTVAQLKQLVTRPDVVEMHDVTARDPRLLVHLKASRNSVPVPRHWCYKRKYLQGKRGIEKTPFELPDFIKATGIEEMRAALQEKEDQKTLKSKMREKVRPKMGKIDIDYQKLHDAFFRFQTKPKMTVHGDLYYEAKEFETKLREKKPGNLTDELKIALGMPVGANSEKVPPPWLIAMQRYGPPPSYPNLKIAGLNAPIPEGCMFGYHAGGWGKPPVDENGKPLYGDVFGTQNAEFKTEVEEDEIDQTVWGELESESESEEESEEEEEEGEDETGLITPAEGLMTPGGISSVPLGMETPDQIELRKRRIEDAMDQGGDTPALYQVLPEKKAAPVGGAMMGSAHVYDVTGVTAPKKPGEKVSTEAVEVSLNPEELDLDTAAMQAKYEQTVREQQSQLEKEDLSDMVAAHAAKQRKRKKAQQDTGKGAKKYKDFKF